MMIHCGQQIYLDHHRVVGFAACSFCNPFHLEKVTCLQIVGVSCCVHLSGTSDEAVIWKETVSVILNEILIEDFDGFAGCLAVRRNQTLGARVHHAGLGCDAEETASPCEKSPGQLCCHEIRGYGPSSLFV
jgi:hypothetical protein